MTNLTLKNIPDDLYHQLKESARLHHRSLNGEILYCLERTLRPRPIDVAERLEEARLIREKTAHYKLTDEEIDTAKRDGRP
ncbi:FitA-like ribbon-helix-helix domain-containing protein [Methylomicrobium sp. RS1]|uniref:FitA-like ribbon-helix-helix domain-containing protein n=1 Tax=Candidatus Methylomicrobium oryzae TaxID=2802053 RepID=UPI0019217526|nr:Arc family DNA-binding protein [Methylomicrobium sp. RS1]MBL1263393.1 Arc family DNA-binding protein [Methylomicrobium sp. RS1]